MLRNPRERGRAKRATEMNASPSMRPAFLPSSSRSGPTASEAMMSPSAWAKAIVPFCRGVSWKRSDRLGRMVPSMAAIIP